MIKFFNSAKCVGLNFYCNFKCGAMYETIFNTEQDIHETLEGHRLLCTLTNTQ